MESKMKFEFKIEEQDFLDYQLFNASTSESISKKKRNGWVLLTLGFSILAIYLFYRENVPLAITYGLFALTIGFLYPKYFKWRYKKHYKTFIKENYSERFGQNTFLEINDEYVVSKDKIGEGKINLSEIKKVDETINHFFIKISTGFTLIIPKRELNNIDEVRNEFVNLGFEVINDLNWKW
jgi:YcxB-like protein